MGIRKNLPGTKQLENGWKEIQIQTLWREQGADFEMGEKEPWVSVVTGDMASLWNISFYFCFCDAEIWTQG
jgi:hypothetical protein